MKKLLLVAAIVALAPMSAMAVDGTITVNGQVNASTCLINGAASPGNISVTLPPVSATSLNTAGNTAGNKQFSIALSGCGSLTKATTYFEVGPNIDATTGYLKNTAVGGATNVQVRLLNDDMSTEIKLNQASGAQASKQFTITSGAATLNYFAQYYATGVATAGPVATSVQYTMQYQ